jgi:hypothetical protein
MSSSARFAGAASAPWLILSLGPCSELSPAMPHETREVMANMSLKVGSPWKDMSWPVTRQFVGTLDL